MAGTKKKGAPPHGAHTNPARGRRKRLRCDAPTWGTESTASFDMKTGGLVRNAISPVD